MFIFTVSKISAQTTGNPKRPDDHKWLSHQMFQPQPRDSEKLTNSDKVVEDIKKLYMEAEKEIETQKRPDGQPQKR